MHGAGVATGALPTLKCIKGGLSCQARFPVQSGVYVPLAMAQCQLGLMPQQFEMRPSGSMARNQAQAQARVGLSWRGSRAKQC
jgi:hypothetical protein